jgi:toxin CcdB
MADQFDLYRDAQGGLFLVLQHEAVDTLDTRIFASCLPAKAVPMGMERLAVPFWFGEAEYCVMVNLLGTARLGRMGRKVGSLPDLRDRITRAIDLIYSGN